jgi:hypothetical protein
MLEDLARVILGVALADGGRLAKYHEIQLPRLASAVLENEVGDLLPDA